MHYTSVYLITSLLPNIHPPVSEKSSLMTFISGCLVQTRWTPFAQTVTTTSQQVLILMIMDHHQHFYHHIINTTIRVLVMIKNLSVDSFQNVFHNLFSAPPLNSRDMLHCWCWLKKYFADTNEKSIMLIGRVTLWWCKCWVHLNLTTSSGVGRASLPRLGSSIWQKSSTRIQRKASGSKSWSTDPIMGEKEK